MERVKLPEGMVVGRYWDGEVLPLGRPISKESRIKHVQRHLSHSQAERLLILMEPITLGEAARRAGIHANTMAAQLVRIGDALKLHAPPHQMRTAILRVATGLDPCPCGR